MPHAFNKIDKGVVEELVSGREAEYQGAWLATGRWIAANARALAEYGDIAFCLVMIHNKLMRMRSSPNNPDHVLDALGYLKLATDWLDQQAATKGRQHGHASEEGSSLGGEQPSNNGRPQDAANQ